VAMPSSAHTRRFYRVAKQRFGDALLLLEMGRTTAAVYLAGYSVECMLKALILSAVPQAQEEEILGRFRGASAHDYEWFAASVCGKRWGQDARVCCARLGPCQLLVDGHVVCRWNYRYA